MNKLVRTTESHGSTEYDVVQLRRHRWYFSDDYGRRFYGITRSIARRRALNANRNEEAS